MMIHSQLIGIDVSKHHLDIFDASSNTTARIDNDEAAISAWLAALADPPQRFVVFEATGRYDRKLTRLLDIHGLRFARVNPARARAFARSLGQLAKTDRIDARMLAVMGQCLNPPASRAPEAAQAHLASLHKRRDQLVAIRQKEVVRLAEAEAGERASLKRHIAWLDKEIAAVESQRDDLLRSNAQLARLNALLRSIPGIGPVTATTLIALMPELGRVSSKAVAALAGLAPFNVDSGQFRGHRAIRGGRRRVRQALYMAAVSAARSKSRFAAFADDMRERGKPFKLTNIAIARKILVTANAIIRDQVPYHP